MPRIAFFEKQEPVEIKTQEGSKMICQCGLSDNFPFCSGAHLKTKDEEKMKVYQYVDGEAMVVGELHEHGHDGCGCGHDDDHECCGKGDGSCHDDKEDHGCGCGHDHGDEEESEKKE